MQAAFNTGALHQLHTLLQGATSQSALAYPLLQGAVALGYAIGAAICQPNQAGEVEVAHTAGALPLVTPATWAELATAGDRPLWLLQNLYVVPHLEAGRLANAVLYAPAWRASDVVREEQLRFLEILAYIILWDQHLQQVVQSQDALAHTDGLTGLYNQRYFRCALQRAYAQAQLERSPLTLLLLDVDYFKRVNDTYGHPVGDLVLSEVAKALSRSIRFDSTLARYGGEEFALLLPRTDTVRGQEVAERLRRAVEGCAIEHHGDDRICVTVSVGVATSYGAPDSTADQLLTEADEALYLSKYAGRNLVTTWEPVIRMLRN